MVREEALRLETLIYDTIERSKIKTGKELTEFAEDLHDIVEGAIYVYAMDEGIYEDYEPSY